MPKQINALCLCLIAWQRINNEAQLFLGNLLMRLDLESSLARYSSIKDLRVLMSSHFYRQPKGLISKRFLKRMVFFMGAEPGGSGSLMSWRYLWLSRWKNFDLSRALMQKYSFISGCSALIFSRYSSDRFEICRGSIFIERFIGASSLNGYAYTDGTFCSSSGCSPSTVVSFQGASPGGHSLPTNCFLILCVFLRAFINYDLIMSPHTPRTISAKARRHTHPHRTHNSLSVDPLTARPQIAAADLWGLPSHYISMHRQVPQILKQSSRGIKNIGKGFLG